MTQAIERLYRLTVDATQANTQLNKISKSTKKIETGFSRLRNAAVGALSVFSTIQLGRSIVEAADQINLLEGSFEALTGSGERAARMLQQVFDTVDETGASLEDTSTTFQRLTVGLKELGGTNTQIETIAETFIKLGRVSGTSMFDTNAALVQFSQGLATGRLQGDELRSIMERLPLITDLIKDEWNRVNQEVQIVRGDVKELGREGLLSAELISNALINGAKLTAEQFANLTFTLEQEQNRLFASLKRTAAEFAKVTGIDEATRAGVRALSDLILGLGRNTRAFVDDLKSATELGSTMRGTLVLLAGAITSIMLPALGNLAKALFLAFSTNPIGILLTALVVAIPFMIANWEKLGNYLQNRVPAFYRSLQASIYEVFADISIGTQEFVREFTDDIRDGMNELILQVRAAGSAVQNFVPFAGILAQLPLFTAGMGEAGEATSSFSEKAVEASAKSVAAMKRYEEGLKSLNETSDDEAGLFGNAGSLTAVLNESMNEFIRLSIAGQKELENWVKEADKIELAVDPMLGYAREVSRVRQLMDENLLSAELGKARIDQLTEAYQNGTKKMVGLTADLSKAGNSFIEGFSTGFADALLDGSNSFSDFAESILEDLARMILRAIIFNAIISGLDGTKLGNFLGIGATSGGGGVTVPTVSTYNASGGGDGAAGILKPRSYGFGEGFAEASGYGSITINNNTNADVEVKQNKENGTVDLDILIENKVKNSINSGGLDKTMRSNYGISRRGY